jgi:hypothetical protein
MRPFVLFFLLAALTLPLQATLVVGTEKGVTAPVPDVPAFDQSAGRIATDGDSFLAVWVDHLIDGSGDVHGARFSPDGKRLDNDVLRIATTDIDENRAGVAFGRDRYLVAWPSRNSLRARFVARDGTMSDAFDVAPLANFNAEPHIVFDGNHFLVSWANIPTYRGALIDLNGAVLKTFDIAPTGQTTFEGPIAAVNGGFQFVSAITDFNGAANGNGFPSDVGVTPIDANGNVGTRVVLAPATTPVWDLSIAVSGNEFAVAWSTAIGIPGGTVRAVRVTPAAAGPVEIMPTEGMYLRQLAADGAGFFVIYGTDTNKYLQRLGTMASIPVTTIPTANDILDAVTKGGRTFVIVHGKPRVRVSPGPTDGDLYLMRLDTGELEPLAVAPRHQMLPDVAAAGELRLAVWCEYIGSDRRLGIIGSRLTANGDAIDAAGIDVHASVYAPTAPRVASNGTDWLAVWADGPNLYGSRIAHTGSLIDATPFLIASGIYDAISDVAVSWDGTQYLVIFLRGQFVRAARTTVRAARVPAQGAITAPELVVAQEAPNLFPAIASGPEASLVVWQQSTVMKGALLSPGGTITPIAFPETFPVTPRPAVAWNNGTFLVAAPHRATSANQIQWLLVSNTGVVRTPLSAFPEVSIYTGRGHSTLEAEAYGEGFLIFWNDTYTDTVYAALVNREGVLVDTPAIMGTAVPGYASSIGAAGNLVVYSHRIGHPTRDIARVFARTVQYTPGKPRRRAVR